MFLEKCKNVFKQSKTSKFITDDIEISFDDSDRENSGDKNSNKENAFFYLFIYLFIYLFLRNNNKFFNLGD